MHGVVLRLQPHRQTQRVHGLCGPPLRLQQHAEVTSHLRIAGIQTHGFVQLRLRVGGTSRLQILHREHVARGSHARFEPDVHLRRRKFGEQRAAREVRAEDRRVFRTARHDLEPQLGHLVG